jgi:hypothetical protein
LNRAFDYGSKGFWFESRRGHKRAFPINRESFFYAVAQMNRASRPQVGKVSGLNPDGVTDRTRRIFFLLSYFFVRQNPRPDCISAKRLHSVGRFELQIRQSSNFRGISNQLFPAFLQCPRFCIGAPNSSGSAIQYLKGRKSLSVFVMNWPVFPIAFRFYQCILLSFSGNLPAQFFALKAVHANMLTYSPDQ